MPHSWHAVAVSAMNNGKDDYSVATFKRLYDFTGDDLAKVRAYADSFKEQVKLILDQRMAERETSAGSEIEVSRPVRTMPDNEGHFAVGVGAAVVSGEGDELPL